MAISADDKMADAKDKMELSAYRCARHDTYVIFQIEIFNPTLH